MSRPRLLDLFCGAGGAAMGYHRAGFDVVGVDVNPQPHFPFEFHQADALEFQIAGFDAIHASPPCQAFTTAISDPAVRARHPNLLPQVKARLVASGLPFVIENVPRAPLDRSRSIQLCGTFFGLRVFRHRLFELSFPLPLVPRCAHGPLRVGLEMESVVGKGHGSNCYSRRMMTVAGNTCSPVRMVCVAGNGTQSSTMRHGAPYRYESLESWRDAMGIDWMSRRELTQAIPPAYTEWIGGHLLTAINEKAS